MNHALRFRSGWQELHRVPVHADAVLQPGDLVYLDAGRARAADQFPFDTDAATTRAAFAAQFLGVCLDASAAGETADVTVDLSPLAVYEFAVVEGTFSLGAYVAPALEGSHLQPRRLTAVTEASEAIGRAAEAHLAPASRLKVRFASAFHPASANVHASLG
ncbi:MAG: hypothetical protein KatS3mg114_1455 [Planctomycetaceae bacterium]|nr:MAG: hypothetical protein KatS3mg114_1455 [Planctomycetaceae bacterium]